MTPVAPEMPEREIQFFQETILTWGRGNYVDFPWRSATNRWHALVAEIMLQRTRAEQVVPVFQMFCHKYPTPASYLADGESSAFASLGLLWREDLLRHLAKILSSESIPTDRLDLQRLPGIGEYIAAAFRSLHLNMYDFIVDSNVVRVYGRFFGFATDPETRRKKWLLKLADKITPEIDFKSYNYGLIDFTRQICRHKPLCGKCPLNQRCRYFAQVQIPSGILSED